MPFIRGRYHINPVLGEALEAAREAENALVALEQEEEHGKESGKDASRGKAPIHRVEIEAAELVPSHSGRGGRGYVARVHRQAASPQDGDDAFGGAGGKRRKADCRGRRLAGRAGHSRKRMCSRIMATWSTFCTMRLATTPRSSERLPGTTRLMTVGC